MGKIAIWCAWQIASIWCGLILTNLVMHHARCRLALKKTVTRRSIGDIEGRSWRNNRTKSGKAACKNRGARVVHCTRLVERENACNIGVSTWHGKLNRWKAPCRDSGDQFTWFLYNASAHYWVSACLRQIGRYFLNEGWMWLQIWQIITT